METASKTACFTVKWRPLFGGLMDTRVKPRISDEERAERRRSVAIARGSVRLEGFVLAPDIEEISRRYIDGELTGDEHVAAIRAAVLNG